MYLQLAASVFLVPSEQQKWSAVYLFKVYYLNLFSVILCIYPKKEDDMGRMITIEKNDQTMLLFFFYGQTRTSLTSLDSHNTFRLSITLLPTHQ